MITDGMMDYDGHIRDVVGIGFIVFILSIMLVPYFFAYICEKNGGNIDNANIFGKTLISTLLITFFSVFFSQAIYYNQEIKTEDLKDLIILEKNFNLSKNVYNDKDVSKIEKILKNIKKDDKITTAEYYVLKNKLDNMKENNIEIKNTIEYNDIKKEFINGGK